MSGIASGKLPLQAHARGATGVGETECQNGGRESGDAVASVVGQRPERPGEGEGKWSQARAQQLSAKEWGEKEGRM